MNDEESSDKELFTCLDCARCYKDSTHEGVGWCYRWGELVDDEYTVEQLDLDCFEVR